MDDDTSKMKQIDVVNGIDKETFNTEIYPKVHFNFITLSMHSWIIWLHSGSGKEQVGGHLAGFTLWGEQEWLLASNEAEESCLSLAYHW